MRAFLLAVLCAYMMGTQLTALGAAPTPNGLAAQILAPLPGVKLRAGETLAVRIRVEGASDAGFSWILSVREESQGAAPTTLATGTEPVRDGVVAELTADQLVAGKPYTLVLVAASERGTAGAEVAFSVPDPLYTLIPLEAGTYARLKYPIYGGDASGNRLFYSGPVADPTELILLDRDTGRRQSVRLDIWGTEGVKLSGDGLRLIFRGSFRLPGNVFESGLGYLDLNTNALSLVAPGGEQFFSTDLTGRRLVYQGLTAARALRYFFYDETMSEPLQLTNDPSAIVLSPDPTFCPWPSATIPLIDADGSTVVLITGATLGLVPDDPSVGCRIFLYDTDRGTLKHLTSLPDSKAVGLTALSADGRWLSFIVTRDLPNGIRRSFPALMDLETGELRDPVVDVGDFTSFDSVITGDGRGVVISTQADLDPRVGNADHNMELFYYDLATGALTQITETTGGIGRHPGGCPSYRPYVSQDASVILLNGFHRLSVESCVLDGPQRTERDQAAGRERPPLLRRTLKIQR